MKVSLFILKCPSEWPLLDNEEASDFFFAVVDDLVFDTDCFLCTHSLSLRENSEHFWKEVISRGRSTETTNGETEKPKHKLT